MAAPVQKKKAGEKKEEAGQDEFSDLLLSFAAGEVAAAEGTADSRLYLIEKGTVELVKSLGAAERVTATLGEGDFFGELAVFEDGATHLVSARAVDEVRVLPIDTAALDYILKEQPTLARRLMQKLATRLRGLEEQALRAHEIAAGALAAEKAPLPEAEDVVAAVGGTVEVSPEEIVGAEASPAKRLGAVLGATLIHDASGTRFELNLDRESRVGRFDPVSKESPDVDLQDLDAGHSLSRRHATFWFEGHCLLLREESGVANGTFIGGRRLRPVRPQVVEHGEKIRFGLVDFTLNLNRTEPEGT
ncbi:MAG: cyclic nucleotide-binding domain-containing protein [Acidobacteriota bacterium]